MKRALLAAVLGGLAVAAFVFMTMDRTRASTTPHTEEDALFIASLCGGLAALAASVVTFVVSRFDAGRRAAFVATGVCVLISAFDATIQSLWEAGEVHAVIWIVFWPVAFGSWIFAELHVGFHRMFQGAQDRAVAAARVSQPPASPNAVPAASAGPARNRLI